VGSLTGAFCELPSQHERRAVGLTSPRWRRQNVVLYAGDAAERALIQEHELRYACDPKSSRRAKFNVLLVRPLSAAHAGHHHKETMSGIITMKSQVCLLCLAWNQNPASMRRVSMSMRCP
jgi:hypothetical protein